MDPVTFENACDAYGINKYDPIETKKDIEHLFQKTWGLSRQQMDYCDGMNKLPPRLKTMAEVGLFSCYYIFVYCD